MRRHLKHYAAPDFLLIDEVGCLSYTNQHTGLLFELISRRDEYNSTVITTNRRLKEWYEVSRKAAGVLSLIDRLVHGCEIVAMEGESYRPKRRRRVRRRMRQAVPLRPAKLKHHYTAQAGVGTAITRIRQPFHHVADQISLDRRPSLGRCARGHYRLGADTSVSLPFISLKWKLA